MKNHLVSLIRRLRRGGQMAVVLSVVLVFFSVSLGVANAWENNNGFRVDGKILEEYQQNRQAGFNYGLARSGEIVGNNDGRVQRFDGGNIYWHALVSNGHANTVGGRILAKYAEKDWERSPLKYPTTREIRLSGGAFNAFEGGSIYWSQATDAHIVYGAIRQKWFDTGAENGIGYPKSDEIQLGRYGGKANGFERASIYWTAATGAHIVGGRIGDIWAAAGAEGGNYGYPVTDEIDIVGGKRQIFQGGPIDFFFDNRPVGLIKMSTFRWQDFIPEASVAVRCDVRWAGDDTIAAEYYNGNNRSWNAEGSSKVRADVNVYVNQANRGAKYVTPGPAVIEPTKQTIVRIGPGNTNTDTYKTASNADMHMSNVARAANDYPDVVRFSVDLLSTQPFCDAPLLKDGISTDFNAGFSASTGAFWMDGDRRQMPNAEAYIRDWVTPGNGGWRTVGQWVKQSPACLLYDDQCGLQSVDRASSNWRGGSVI